MIGRGALATGLLLLAACVPSTEDLDPHGAAGFRFEPTAATRGEPFETSDGYRVTVERLVVLLAVQATVLDPNDSDNAYGSSDWVLADARGPAPVYCPGVPAGDVQLHAFLSQLVVHSSEDPDPALAPGAADLLPRFRERADVRVELHGSPEFQQFGYGPSVLLVFHAEGHGKRYQANLTLEGTAGYSGEEGFGRVEVVGNQLATAPLQVRAEQLFIASAIGTQQDDAEPPAETAPEFAPFARTDTNDDGIISGEELRAASYPRRGIGGFTTGFAGELILRTAGLFAPAAQ